ncbi:hypothetical protein BKA80DRAFT_275161 [Phyllosticta citrichinensis]
MLLSTTDCGCDCDCDCDCDSSFTTVQRRTGQLLRRHVLPHVSPPHHVRHRPGSLRTRPAHLRSRSPPLPPPPLVMRRWKGRIQGPANLRSDKVLLRIYLVSTWPLRGAKSVSRPRPPLFRQSIPTYTSGTTASTWPQSQLHGYSALQTSCRDYLIELPSLLIMAPQPDCHRQKDLHFHLQPQ